MENASGGEVSALGNTFEIDATAITSPFRIEDRIIDGGDVNGSGLVTFLENSVVVPTGGDLQAAIDAIDALYKAVYKRRFPASQRGLTSKLDF